MNDSDSTLKLGEERVPVDEAAAIDTVLASTLALLDTRTRPVRRAQHAKQHGCVEAEFRVGPDVPLELRHGLFATPGVYPAIIRFSNGGKLDDRQKDAHGMAVKVMGLEALGREDQDFVMADSPVFFLRDAADYARFSRALCSARSPGMTRLSAALPRTSGLLAFAVLYFKFFRGHRRELGLLKAFTAHVPHNPLASQYFSATPYRLGPHAIRFSARPAPSLADAVAAQPSSPARRNQLGDALRHHFENQNAHFDFLVQRQTDARAMPVENTTIPWDEEVTPYLKVASLRIPPQSIDEKSNQRCEPASFSPWNTLDEHAPLGGINRVRRAVYSALFAKRQVLNQQACGE